MNKEIDIGVLTQCYRPYLKCHSKTTIKIQREKYKGEEVYICSEGYSQEDNDCPYIAQSIKENPKDCYLYDMVTDTCNNENNCKTNCIRKES